MRRRQNGTGPWILRLDLPMALKKPQDLDSSGAMSGCPIAWNLGQGASSEDMCVCSSGQRLLNHTCVACEKKLGQGPHPKYLWVILGHSIGSQAMFFDVALRSFCFQ
jgi:hypothetical protein